MSAAFQRPKSSTLSGKLTPHDGSLPDCVLQCFETALAVVHANGSIPLNKYLPSPSCLGVLAGLPSLLLRDIQTGHPDGRMVQVGNGYNLQHMPLSNSRPLADPHQGPSFLGRPRAFPVPNEHAVRP